MKLSMIVPSIRIENLPAFYHSVKESFSEEFEMVVVSPYQMIPEFDNNYNIKWIESHANPTVCQQLGLIAARGEYVCFGWDDGLYCEGSLDKAFTLIKENTAISGKYIEGDIAPAYMKSEKYYHINTHARAQSPYVPNEYMIFNTGIILRQTLLDIGGFNHKFEATALAFIDLSIRLQLYGIKVILMEEVMMTCTWMPGDEGDHAPVHAAMEENDFSLLHKMYRQPIFHKRVVIDIDNWKLAPKIWERRFGSKVS